MTTTVSQGSQKAVAVSAGLILSVTAGAGGACACEEGVGRSPRINVAAGLTRTFGPFPWDRVLNVYAIGDDATFVLSTGAQSGERATYDFPAASENNVDPGGGWPTNFDRLVLTAVGSAGASAMTGLKAGTDGQRVIVTNNDASSTITLTNQSSSSTAANRFLAHADVALTTGSSVLIEYDGTLGFWVVR
jgi:hypothetical protein